MNYIIAKSAAEALDALLGGEGNALIIAGGSDVMVDIEAGKLAPQTLVDVTAAEDMKGIRVEGGQLVIGAAVTLTEIARSPMVRQYFPSLCKGAGSVGSLQIRNSATLVGNVVTAQPAGDAAMAVAPLDPKFVVLSKDGTRVEAVCTFENTTNKPFNTSATMVTTPRPAEPVRDQTIFTDEPKYIGDEIAAVAAETEAIAAEAIKLIKVEYEELPAVYDPIEALKPDAPEVQPVYGNKEHRNVCGEIVKIAFCESEPYSDEALDRGFAQADVIVEADVKLPRVKQCQMEVHAAVASYKANGTLEIISTTQTPTPTKMIVAYAFDMPESKVRVRNPPYLGGGFGVRIGISGKAELLAAALSMKALRPVKLVYTREEDFIASDTRHGGYMHARLGARKDGTFVALDTTAKLNTGAYCTFGVELLAVCGVCGTAGTYHIPYLRYTGYPVYTHQQTAGAFRGFGTPQGTAVVEACVDKIAQALDMDPIELRKINTMKPDDKNFFPFSVGSVGTNECLDKAAAEIGWYEKRGKAQTGNKRRGVGIACNTHVSNAAPFCVDYNAVDMVIEQDGSLRINTAIPEIGPGSTTALIQVACDLLSVPFETTTMIFGDSAAAPFDIGSHATRTLYSVSQVWRRPPQS